MKILAIDTSTEACSAALNIDGEIYPAYKIAPREHSRLILTMIDDLLAESDTELSQLDAIAFGRGPGSFMGLRIAAGVTQGIAFVNDTPVIPVSTLMAIAEVSYIQTGSTRVLAAIDARMDEVYWGAFRREHERWLIAGEEQVVPPDTVIFPEDDSVEHQSAAWLAAGTGWASFRERLLEGNDYQPVQTIEDCFPSAEAIARIAVGELEQGNTCKAHQAVPVYLRNNVAKKPRPVVF